MNTAEFLARLGPVHFIRAIWPKKQRGAVPDGHKDSYQFYGTWNAELAARCATLNQLGYSIYYGSNDPGCPRFLEANVKKLRLIYRDCDTSEAPRSWELKDGSLVPSHIHYVTSPGKSQSVWLIEEIPSDHIGIIHNKMVEWSGHDASTSGCARLLRLPGFLNTKYDPAPLCEVVSVLDAPPMPAAAVLRHFGIGAGIAGNLTRTMNRVQSGSGGTATVLDYKTDIAKAQRATPSLELEEDRLAERLTGQKQNFRRDTLLRVLAVIDPFERGNWVKVGKSLKFMFRASEHGLELFDEWSKLAPAKYQQGACKELWSGNDRDEHIAHWGTLRSIASRLPTSDAVHTRLAKLMAFGLLMPEYLSIQVIAFAWKDVNQDGTKLVVDHGSMINAYQAIEHGEPSIHFDEFANEVRTDRGSFQDRDENALYADTKELGLRWTQANCRVAIDRYADNNKRNPALDFVRRLSWDETERLETVFIRHLGAPDTPYIREVTKLHFIAMVRRIKEPGCKYDYMPILRGKGGLGKSSLFKRLMPVSDWFTDAPKLNMPPNKLYPLLRGKLCVEFAELAGKSTGVIEEIKAFTSRQMDEYTDMYGRRPTKTPRVAVCIGTTNDAKFLRDMTGNRRFPIVPTTRELNFAEIDAEREQIWAEAAFLEGVYGDLMLSQDSVSEMEEIQKDAMDYEEGVEEFLDQADKLGHGFIASHTFREYFGIDALTGRLSEASKIRFSLKQIKEQLRTRGWTEATEPKYIDGKRQRGLYKSDLLGDIREIVYSAASGLHHIPQGTQE